ncbi:MAG: D-arginine dehydrogenase [Parasphingorhabdus sp.]|jgi:D-arginine dehydrogenase
MNKENQYDVIVVGAGIAGISLAAVLSENLKVLLLDKESQPMFHSTSRSAALLIENYGGDIVENFIRASRPFLEYPPESFSEFGFLKRRGVLNLTVPGEEAAFKHMGETFNGVEVLTPPQLSERFPLLREECFIGGVLDANAMDLDVDLLCQAYLRQMRKNNGALVCGKEVHSLQRIDGLWKVVAGGNEYSAPLVANCAGAWCDDLAEKAGARRLGLVPHRRSAAMVEFENKPDPAWPMMASHSETWYAKPQGEYMMVSLADQTPVAACDIWPEGIDIATGIDNFQQVTNVGEVKQLIHAWAGLRTFAPDKHPVVGFDPEVEGFFWLGGQGGSGIHAGPALAECAKALICNNELPDWMRLDKAFIEALSPSRF